MQQSADKPDVDQKLTALFKAIDARYAVADDYSIEFDIWIWHGDPIPITYWARLKYDRFK